MSKHSAIFDSIRDSIKKENFPIRYPTLEEHTWYNKNEDKKSAIINDADEKNKELILFLKNIQWRLGELETKGYIQNQKKTLRWQGGEPMLSTEIYTFISGLVKKMTKGTILELGTYSGGVTVNTALAIHNNSNNQNIDFIAVEHCPHNQSINGKDQYYYCTQNLANAVGIDLRPYVDYIKTHAPSQKIDSKLQQLNPIELLIIDANGELADQLERYLPYCANGCILVIDDYWMIEKWELHKGPSVRACINRLVDEGILRVVSLCTFSTIILIYGDKDTLGELEYMPEYGTIKDESNADGDDDCEELEPTAEKAVENDEDTSGENDDTKDEGTINQIIL